MTVSPHVTQFLDSRGIFYRVDHHKPCYTAQSLAQTEAITGYRVAKTVLCIADERAVILVLPAPFQIDMDLLADSLGADEVRLADADELEDFLIDCDLEVVPPPLPLWKNIKIHVDRSMLAVGEIVFSAGSPSDAVHMNMNDWLGLCRPSFGSFSKPVVKGDDSLFSVITRRFLNFPLV